MIVFTTLAYASVASRFRLANFQTPLNSIAYIRFQSKDGVQKFKLQQQFSILTYIIKTI